MKFLPLSLAVVLWLAAADARAGTVTKCPQGTYGVYYVLFAEQATLSPIFSMAYNAVGAPEPRRFDELAHPSLDFPVFYAMCSNDVPDFEVVKGIHRGTPLRGTDGGTSELYRVLNGVEKVVGTVWHDTLPPFDQGGSIGGQSYWTCGDPLTPVINNFAAFSSGLDTSAINSTSAITVERKFLGYIRSSLLQAVGRSMQGEGCVQVLTKADFVALPSLPDTEVWYRVVDLTKGGGDTP